MLISTVDLLWASHQNGLLFVFAVDLSLVNGDEDCIYLCNNSLGLMPRKVEEVMAVELKKWAEQ